MVYDGVKELLSHVRDSGRDVLIITNSSKTAEVNIARLDKMFGLSIDRHYSSLVSSAQLLRDWVFLRSESRPCRIHLVGAAVDSGLVRDTLAEIVPLEECDFVLLVSLPDNNRADWLARLRRLDRPVLVPSCDAASVTARGLTTGLGPWVSDLIASGVDVRNFGKPSTSFYDACNAYWCDGQQPRRVLAVGDQLQTDVVGAARYGWSSALVLTGAGTQSRASSAAASPDYVIQSLRL
ncbi:HAD hydrolase-like protein [Nocardia asteroides]|uniref:HAD hydrolase-like protein n=1 Tax=Nocardia asteroides TaxID=1824 RepID=UPI003B3AF09D